MKAQSEAYVFLDVFARGHYNSYYFANMKNEGTMPEILDGDLEILKKGLRIHYLLVIICRQFHIMVRRV